jgi:arylsulfatase A-like enzyme
MVWPNKGPTGVALRPQGPGTTPQVAPLGGAPRPGSAGGWDRRAWPPTRTNGCGLAEGSGWLVPNGGMPVPPDRPHVLFIFADQMRGMDMGCAGNPDVHTPHMDRLAAEGTCFARAYANCPVCTPSRATMLTGRHALATRVVANDLPLPEDVPTIGTCLHAAGYRTGYIGKWHLDGVPRGKWTPPGPRRHGFDDFWAVHNCSHAYLHAHYFRDAPEPIPIEGYEPSTQTDLLLRFLDERDDRPWAAFLSWGPPHDPYDQVPASWLRRYDPQALRLRPNVRPIPPGAGDLARGREPRGTLAAYYAQISALDAELGRILAYLDAQGLAHDTIVVFTSDHGDMLWSQGHMMKQQPWEESIRVPFLLRWPGRVPAGRTTEGLVGLVDLLPTLLHLAGVPLPSGVQGSDLADLALGRSEYGDESVYLYDLVAVDQSIAQGIPEWRGVRTPRHTYARTRQGPWLLYDNVADPYQLVNLVGASHAVELQRHLDAEVDRWLRRTGDPFIDGLDLIARLGLAPLWNVRERELHPQAPRLVGVNP